MTDREGVQTLTVCWSPGWVWLGSEAQGKGKAPWPVVERKSTPHDSATVHFLALSLRNGAQRFCPASCCSQPAEEEDAVGVSQPQLQGLEAAEGRYCHGQDRASWQRRQKREAFFLSSFRFHRASLPNSSGDMAKTLEKSSADKCLSSLMRSTPGGSLVLPLLVTTSIS